MARLILALLLLAALALAVAASLMLARALRGASAPMEVTMPGSVRKVSYVLLVLLLLGVTSGWLAPA